MKTSALLAVLLSVSLAVAAFAAEQEQADFFQTRADVLALYGESSRPALKQLYAEMTTRYKANPVDGLLYRRAAFAELAGLYGQQEEVLLDILSGRRDDASFASYCIEVLRSHGTLSAHSATILSAIDAMDDQPRRSALKSLARAFAWSRPPDVVMTAVENASKEAAISVLDLVSFTGVLASWGRRDEAAGLLLARSKDKGLSADEMQALTESLRRMNLRKQAREVFITLASRLDTSGGKHATSLDERYTERESDLETLINLARAAGCWDLLIRDVSSRDGVEPLIDAAVALDAAGARGERADALWRLFKKRGDAEAAAIYAGALMEAGDAFSTQNTLLTALLSGPSLGDDPYMDLFDAVAVLRDPETLLSMAAIYARFRPQPQVARMMSEYVRALGDFRTADRLFATFITGTGLGQDTRFNWEGGRLLAEYYLATGRLSEGEAAARKALAQFIDAQGAKSMTQSAQGAKFVALFARFGGVESMYAYCVGREADFPGSAVLMILEKEALEHLGRWDEAAAIENKTLKNSSPAERDVVLAAAASRAGRVDEAVSLYERATASDKNMPRFVYVAFVEALARAGRWDDVENILQKMLAGDKGGMFLYLGELYRQYGQDERALRSFMKLDDLTLSVGPEQAGFVARFLAESGHAESLAAFLERRLSVQTSFDDKQTYLEDCLPRTTASCPAYIAAGEMLGKGPLRVDHALMGLYYRGLAGRASMFGDSDTVFAASVAAFEADPNTVDSAVLVARLSWADGALREGAAEAAYAVLPAPSLLVDLATAEMELARTDSAAAHLSQVLDGPLYTSELSGVLDLLDGGLAAPELLKKAADSANEAWPWIFHARLADAALRAGERDLALAQAQIVVNDGVYVARALWAVDFYARAGAGDKAASTLALFAATLADHPALSLVAIDVASSRGDVAGAGEAAASVLRVRQRYQFAALFRMEAARIAATSRSEIQGAGEEGN